MPLTCHFSAATLTNLRTYLTRIQAIDPRATLRLVAKGSSLGIYCGILYPQHLLDNSATVLGLRAFRLENQAQFDTALSLDQLLAALDTRQEETGLVDTGQETLTLADEPAPVRASWLGLAPPMTGWEPAFALDSAQLAETARAGVDAVAKALPQNPGHAVLDTVRSRIWSSPLSQESHLPSGIAFTAQALGFLPVAYEGELPVLASGNWYRVNLPGGFVLTKVKN